MYIEIHDWKEFEQKVLYFKLNNSLNMNLGSTKDYKVVGIYAIYKDDLCLYVGQSKNLASRIATHLKGKYENATNIYMWDIEKIGFADFRSYTKEIQEQIIIRCEKYLMTVLKPIENLDIDMSYIIYNDDEKPNIKLNSSSCYTIQNDEFDLKITDSYPHLYEELCLRIDWLHFHKKIDDSLHALLREEIDNEDLKYFYGLGVEDEKSI